MFTDKNNDGLIRQSANESDNEVLSIRNYSPFGLELGGSHQNIGTQNSYKFGGKEVNGFTGYSDFGGRWLDKNIGGWTSQDRFSEVFSSKNAYNFSLNDPINFKDPDGNYAVSVHYKITYDALIGRGYSKERADLIAHYSSTYADHPPQKALFLDFMLHPLETKTHFYRNGIIYNSTEESQEEKNSHWHSMMSDREAAEGMTEAEALKRGLKTGWDFIFESKFGSDLGKLGQGLHALQDAIAHKGAKTSDHLGWNLSSAGKFYNDLYGDTKKASNLTNSALIVIDLLQNKKKLILEKMKR